MKSVWAAWLLAAAVAAAAIGAIDKYATGPPPGCFLFR